MENIKTEQKVFLYSTFQLNRVLLLLVGFILISTYVSKAQFAFVGGLNYSNERNNNLLENQKPIISYHFGACFRFYPIKKLKTISLQNELIFNQKGYKQVLDRTYTFLFSYISMPVLINYALTENFSINTGIEFGGLLSSNIKRRTETYNDFDIGLILGFTCFEKSNVNFYSRVTYGLLPILDYYAIDKLGNFTGEIHDLKNICLSVGMKIKLYNEKKRLNK